MNESYVTKYSTDDSKIPGNVEKNDKKIIFITGCSSGIGLETSIECAKKGHYVFAGVRSTSDLTDLKRRISDERLNFVKIIKIDVAEVFSIKNAVSQIIQEKGRIDVLFNNAGFMMAGSLEDLSINEIQLQINTDLIGPTLLTKFVIPHMRDSRHGIIINMSSVAGKIGFQLSSPYCISKFGIEGLTESLRRELAPQNIKVCLIEAGVVDTKFFENIRYATLSKSSTYAKETKELGIMLNKMVKKRWSSPKHIAEKVVEIIDDNGQFCKYIIGDDAEYLVDIVFNSKDNCKLVDEAIGEIMKRYSE